MSIATVNVPVPASGDGPVVSVANLVAVKTVVLSGYFTRAWSIGAADAIQAQKGLVIGTGVSPPGEGDLAVGPGATNQIAP